MAKTVPIYTHPKAVAAPTTSVTVKDMDPATGELEAILNKVPEPSGDLMPAPSADAGDVAIPPPVPPVQIIPSPSEMLPGTGQETQAAAPLSQMEKILKGWTQKWRDTIQAVAMAGFLLFTGLLYLVSRGQYKILKRAVKAAEMAAQAAKQSAEAAQMMAAISPATERPYVFLEPNVQGSVSSDNAHDNTDNAQVAPAQFTIKFAFRNHGRTPALIADLQASGSYWSVGYPEALFAASHTASQGMVISPGEKSPPFTLVFSVGMQELQEAYNGNGQLLFWGKLLYRDMFGELRETAFCRCYRFEEKAFRVAQAETLNYHT